MPAAAQTDDDSTFTPIEPGETMTVELDGSGPVLLALAGAAGDVLTITARGPADDDNPLNDPVLAVLRENGMWLAYNDNHRGNGEDGSLRPVDARLTDLTLPADERYLIRVDTYSGIYAMPVTVSVDQGELYALTVDQSEAGLIRIEAALPAHRPFTYVLDLEAGTAWTITAQDSDGMLDPLLIVTGPDDEIIAQNDDHDSDDLTLNAFDSRLRLPVDTAGRYRVTVRDFLGRSGAFLLTLSAE